MRRVEKRDPRAEQAELAAREAAVTALERALERAREGEYLYAVREVNNAKDALRRALAEYYS